MIINVPIEPLEGRYSEQWNNWFEEHLQGKDYHTILPTRLDVEDKIVDGAFLDIVGTNYFKAKQIAFISSLIRKGHIPRDKRVVFIFHDGWFPIEQLAYIRDGLGCHEWKFIGIFHDGTYDQWDFTARKNMYIWGEDLENSWFRIYDAVVVGSQYHKDVLLEKRKIAAGKVHVIPWKVEVPEDLIGTKKENIVVFPHRLDVEKQPQLFVALAERFKDSGYQFITTQSKVRSKREYYELLAKSKICVSFSLLEMFGIAMVEAALLRCVPLVPDRLSYRELFPSKYRYLDFEDLCWLVSEYMHAELYSSHFLTDQYYAGDFFPSLFDLVGDV